MIVENKRKIDETLNEIPDEYVNEILEYLNSIQLKQKLTADNSSMLLSEKSLSAEWFTKQEEDAWAHL